jgi:hypothetical protein
MMNWQKAPLFLATSVASTLVLLAFVVLLSARAEAPAEADTVQAVHTQAQLKFPPGFGRLDELVQFQGGVAPVATDIAPAVEHGPEYRDSNWVNSQSPESFTIQVLAAQDEDAVKRFLAEREDRTRFVYFLYPQGGIDWLVVTTGNYPSHELAAGIIEASDFGTLPARPFPRRMGTYQEALRAPESAASEAPPVE